MWYVGTNDKEKTINSSTKLGNYYNNSFTNYSKINCLWALHGDVGSSQLENATTYTIGQVTVKPDEKYKNNDNTGKNRIELATGVCDDFKIYNIYDMAGNMFEYTTGHNIKIINNKNRIRTVSRGGGFKYAGDTYPIAFANGSGAISAGDVVCGFRVVLYIK